MKQKILFINFFVLILLVQPIVNPADAQINTDRVMAIGRNALYFEDYVLSIQYFNQVINAKPHLAEPYFFRAVAKLYLEDYKGADDDCTKALERNNFLVRAYLCRSYARMSLKDYAGSIADCEKGLEFEPDHQNLMQNKALGQLYAKEYDLAEQSLKDIVERYPNHVYSYMVYGQLNIERGDTLAAVEDFSRAIAIDRHFAAARAGRAYVYLLLENYANALPDLDEAIRLDPDIPGYYINRGLARYNLNNLRGTLDDFDRVIRLDPANELAWFNRGLIRSQVGDINRAIEDFDKVIYLDPNYHLAVYNRALLRSQTGDYKGAIEDLNIIINEYPKFTPAIYQRSEIKRKAGDAKGADKDYFAAWNLDDKLKAEREDRRKNPEKYAVADSIRDAEREKKRDMERYNRIILAETDDVAMNKYQNPMRGRVQDQHVEVEMEDLFTLTFYEKSRPGPTRRIMDYSGYLSVFIMADMKEYHRLLITNHEEALNDQQASYHFSSIDALSSKISQDPSIPVLFLARALDFALVQDINSALEDLNRAITLDPDFVLAYFSRANLRYRKINVEYAERQNEADLAGSPASLSGRSNSQADRTITSNNGHSIGTLNDLSSLNTAGQLGLLYGENAFGMDYELVMRDYERVLELDPTFIYAWYNRGNIRCFQRDYRNALIDFTRALELNPDFADAWYNRGITQIYLGDRAHGLADLRMAGQLGLYKAYNLIKRFEN